MHMATSRVAVESLPPDTDTTFALRAGLVRGWKPWPVDYQPLSGMQDSRCHLQLLQPALGGFDSQ